MPSGHVKSIKVHPRLLVERKDGSDCKRKQLNETLSNIKDLGIRKYPISR